MKRQRYGLQENRTNEAKTGEVYCKLTHNDQVMDPKKTLGDYLQPRTPEEKIVVVWQQKEP